MKKISKIDYTTVREKNTVVIHSTGANDPEKKVRSDIFALSNDPLPHERENVNDVDAAVRERAAQMRRVHRNLADVSRGASFTITHYGPFAKDRGPERLNAEVRMHLRAAIGLISQACTCGNCFGKPTSVVIVVPYQAGFAVESVIPLLASTPLKDGQIDDIVDRFRSTYRPEPGYHVFKYHFADDPNAELEDCVPSDYGRLLIRGLAGWLDNNAVLNSYVGQSLEVLEEAAASQYVN